MSASGDRPLLPGTRIGIAGGGQLGRLLACEARRMGYHVAVLDPAAACPAAPVADEQVVGRLDDPAAFRRLADQADVVICEFENVAGEALAAIADLRPVYPNPVVLTVAQHRVREKESLARLGFPVPPYAAIRTAADLEAGLEVTGLPAVLKTATGGYDGRGQAVVRSRREALAVYQTLRSRAATLILEALVPFRCELSVVCARDVSGRTTCFPVAENIHREGILEATVVPARVPSEVAEAAKELAAAVAVGLDLVGLLAVEMFLTEDGRLLINELAPRPHNSGHYTLDACACSQFEQLLRVACRLPLGATDLLSSVAMVNLLGEVWIAAGGEPDFAAALAVPGVRLYLYEKHAIRPRRKMGHLCAVAPDPDLALARALAARALAMRKPPGAAGSLS